VGVLVITYCIAGGRWQSLHRTADDTRSNAQV